MVEEVPSPVVFLMADPNFEILVDPGTGMEMGQQLLVGHGLERFRHGGGDDTHGVAFVQQPFRKRRIEVREKPFTPFMVMLPGVFTVQDDGNEDVVLRRLKRDVLDAAQDVVTSGIKRGLMVEKSEIVRDVAITKDDCHFAGRTGAIGAIELGWAMPRLV